MTKARYRKYQKAIKEGASFERLKKLIGKPLSAKNQGDSCYGTGGEDWIYKYKNFLVYVYKSPAGKLRVISLTGR